MRSLPPPTQAPRLRATLLYGLEALAVGVPEDLCAYMAASAKAAATPMRPVVAGPPQAPAEEGGQAWPLVCDIGVPTVLHGRAPGVRAISPGSGLCRGLPAPLLGVTCVQHGVLGAGVLVCWVVVR